MASTPTWLVEIKSVADVGEGVLLLQETSAAEIGADCAGKDPPVTATNVAKTSARVGLSFTVSPLLTGFAKVTQLQFNFEFTLDREVTIKFRA